MTDIRSYRESVDRLIESEKGATTGGDLEGAYQAMHGYRHGLTVGFCKRWEPSPEAKVLDVGRSAMTGLLAGHYRNLSTLGFPISLAPGEKDPFPQIPHIEFDLTLCGRPETWPDRGGEFDLIVYCETIEHLYIAPEFSLLFLGYLLKPGGIILVTTPNAARLGNRIRLALGRNPFERIRYFDRNPGHFREYTRDELRDMAGPARLECIEARAVNLYPKAWRKLLASFRPLEGLADNLFVVFRKP